MGVLDVVRGLATVGGAGYGGYAQDQQAITARALATIKAQRDAENDRVLNTVRMAGIDPDLQGRIAGAKVAGETPGLINRQRLQIPLKVEETTAVGNAQIPIEVAKQDALAPGEVKKAADTAAAVAPTTIATHAATRDYDNANPAPVQPGYSPVVTTGPEGEQHVSRFNTKTGDITDTGVTAKMAGTGGATRQQRIQALANVNDALNSFETTLATTGSVVMPGAAKSGLQTDYENLQLQMKELYNLGVLNGPDLALMRRIINDPTDLTGRALAFGSGDEQAKRIQAQVQQVREKIAGFQKNLAAGSAAMSTPSVAGPDRPPGFRP